MTASPEQVKALQGFGVFVLAGSAALAAAYGQQYAFLVPLNTLISWLVGKLLGVPLNSVVQDAVKRMPAEDQVSMTVSAVQALPSESAKAVADDVLARIAQHSVASMPPERAKHMTRALLETIDPIDKARILEKIVFISSHPPAANTKAAVVSDTSTDQAPATAADNQTKE